MHSGLAAICAHEPDNGLAAGIGFRGFEAESLNVALSRFMVDLGIGSLGHLYLLIVFA
jgi:hypothetical protein